MRTAILIDGGFFLKRYPKIYPGRPYDPKTVAKELHSMAFRHLNRDNGREDILYRIFYYDCPPLIKKVHNPITNRVIDFSKTPQTKFRLEFFEELKKLRKVALRLGHLQDGQRWLIRKEQMKLLLGGKMNLVDLKEEHVQYDMKQKGVDIKIGIDIASLAYKKLADKVILISGDSDFVSAARLARREGIDFVLDPLWNPISPSLFEHIDGLQSVCPNPFPRRPTLPS
ncbi:MAG: NYN domain-containing protein [Verrucomicrobia bacterium]|nr:NYN domain-containing protein [Verrucomicrobiota bacterium]